ncbi:MAG: CDP-alcohol phosphatidyltransferase family protein [Acidobacteria bacterium]|nr:CDP-alcohol phosphatidyltransferase family protein [Acidobacteriota bacterium]
MSELSLAGVRVGFRNAERKQESWLAPLERRCLAWLAERMPAAVGPDHLTLLGFAALLMAGVCYAAAEQWPPALLLVNVCLAVNWFGDSLDGTLARHRKRQRPRYGFYVDHMVDSFGALFLIGGLALSGLASERVAAALLVSYFLLSINSYLATYTRGTFQLSFWKFSPTEVRILLAIGNAVALRNPHVTVFGHTLRFFDVGGVIAAAVMAVVLIVSVAQNTRALYREEKI